MINLLIVFGIVFLLCTFIYEMFVVIMMMQGDFAEKKTFLLWLIPWYSVYAAFMKMR